MKNYKHRRLNYIPDAVLTAYKYVFGIGIIIVIIYEAAKYLFP